MVNGRSATKDLAEHGVPAILARDGRRRTPSGGGGRRRVWRLSLHSRARTVRAALHETDGRWGGRGASDGRVVKSEGEDEGAKFQLASVRKGGGGGGGGRGVRAGRDRGEREG